MRFKKYECWEMSLHNEGGLLENTATRVYKFYKWELDSVKHLAFLDVLSIPKDIYDEAQGGFVSYNGVAYNMANLASRFSSEEEASDSIISNYRNKYTHDNPKERIYKSMEFQDYLDEKPHLLL